MSAKDEVEVFKRRLLQERLDKLTEPQRAMFKRVFPKVTPDCVMDAIDLCDRTIKKNERLAPPEYLLKW